MIAETTTATQVSQLILARLLAPLGKRPSPSALCKGLESLFEKGSWKGQFAEELAGLEAAGLVVKKPLRLTDEGRRVALEFLRVAEVPEKLDWRTIRSKYLVPMALGISAEDETSRQRLAGANGLRAAVIERKYDLPSGPEVSLPQAIDALVWQELGFEPDQELTLAALRCRVMKRFLDIPGKVDPKQIGPLLAMQAMQTRTRRADDLRLAVLRDWLKPVVVEPNGGVPPVPVEPVPEDQPASTLDLATFAERVQEAAQRCATGRFGENKVFIAHVWGQLQAEKAFPDLSESEFKTRLAEANHQGLLRLSRADLVEVMNPEDVRASETTYLNAQFHFVLCERNAP